MTERGGQEWTLADFRRHLPRIIAERDRAEAALADREQTIRRVRELWQRIDSGTTINVIRQSLADELLAALDATGGSDDGDPQ